MRNVFAFLVVCCFLLLKGPSATFGQTFQKAAPSFSNQHLEKAAFKADLVNLDFSILQKTSRIDKIDNYDNIENEDDDTLIFGNYLPLVIASFYVLLAFYLFSSVKHRLPFCKHLSYAASSIYLRQGVLRI